MVNNCMENGTLRYNPRNPRYFADGSGESVYLTGSHTWAVMNDIWLDGHPRDLFDYDGFIQMMADNGHNFLRFWQWMGTRGASWDQPGIHTRFDPQPYERTGPGLARDGEPKFDLSKWNEAYFERLRERVEKAGRKGIYVSVMLFDGWNIKFANAENDIWNSHPMNGENNVNGVAANPVSEDGKHWELFSLKHSQLLDLQKRYVRKIVETLNDYDHVLYEVGNEVPYTQDALDWMEAICLAVKEIERGLPKQHPVGITAEGRIHDNEKLFRSSADWISPSNGPGHEYRYNPPAADGRKVVLTDTDHLWGHGSEIHWIWKSFMRGLNVLFMDPWGPLPCDNAEWLDEGVTLNQRYYHAWDVMRRNLGYTRNVALSFDMNRMTPDVGFCTSGYCLANRNEQYACYFPSGGFEGLDLRGLSGEFTVEWLNPMTGAMVSGGKLVTEPIPDLPWIQSAAMRAPFEGPAVLLFYKHKKTR